MLGDLCTFVDKAVPDTKLTIKKYADIKFEYLVRFFITTTSTVTLNCPLQSYCLKIKEMDDEEYTYQALHEPLYRVETGNYEYRLILRCRSDARVKFAALRSDVMVKMELLDQKHVQDIVKQLQTLISSLAKLHTESYETLKDCILFPLEVDLSANCSFTYPDPLTSPYQDDEEEESEQTKEEDLKMAEEAIIKFGDLDLSSSVDLLTRNDSAANQTNQDLLSN